MGEQWSKLQVLISSNSDTPVWYQKDPAHNRIIIWGTEEGEVSYRLTAARFDWTQWGNISNEQGDFGLTPPDYVDTGTSTDDSN